MAFAAQLTGNAQCGWARRGLIIHHSRHAFPFAPQEGIDIPLAKAIDRFWQLTLKREPAHLTIGHYI